MKVLFLDIDGVLNDHGRMMNLYCGIQKDKVDLVNHIVNETECKLVLSSAWRYMILGGDMTLKGFEYLMITHGLKCHGLIIDTTVCDSKLSGREQQIKHWLDNTHFNVTHCCVLDDLDLNFSSLNIPFVRTDGKVGLTREKVDEVISILGKPINTPDLRA